MDGLLEALHTVHREVFLPEFERIIRTAFDGLRFDWRDRFNEVLDRFDRLDAQADWLLAALKRVDAQIDRIEAHIDRIDGSLDRIETRFDSIEAHVDRILEDRLGE